MAVSILDEDIPHSVSEFTPFDDSRAAPIKKAASESRIVNISPINTSEIDHLRQGIEITSQAYRFKGMAKFWAGNIKGYTKIQTYGQALPFTEYENNKIWQEKDNFNPVNFILLGQDYPFPIIFNDGPPQDVEVIVRPFTLSFLSHITEIEAAHDVRGSVEDGNQDVRKLGGFTSQIKQFIDFRDPRNFVPFLDEGQRYYGDPNNLSENIETPNFLNDGEATISPFDDLGNQKIVNKISTTDEAFLSVMYVSLSYNLDNDIRSEHDIKSAPAGYDVYGPNQAQYGTDSITYIGIFKGN